eukprot:COSAG02_NODE_64547_length_260_cov_0.645963_1_plen_35_part_01
MVCGVYDDYNLMYNCVSGLRVLRLYISILRCPVEH